MRIRIRKKEAKKKLQKVKISWGRKNIVVVQKECISVKEVRGMQKILSRKPQFVICDAEWKFTLLKRK